MVAGVHPLTFAAVPVTADEWQPPANLYGGCILMTPIGEVPEDLYTVTDVVPATDIPPFTKKLTVYGLTLAAGDDASDDFMRLVAQTITEIFSRDEALEIRLKARPAHRETYLRVKSKGLRVDPAQAVL
jgi:hypothetical protein